MTPLRARVLMAVAVALAVFGAALYLTACEPDQSGETLAFETADARARGWDPIFTDDFGSGDIGYGQFPDNTKWWAYCSGWHDTSHNGVYRPESVVSQGNGRLDLWLHTNTGEHQVAAPVPLALGETYNSFGTPGCGSGSAWNGQLYGRYSARFRSDPVPGYKTAWLLWPDSDNPAEGEIDWMESQTDLGGVICAFLHRTDGQTDNYCTTKTYGSWHTATVEWTPGKAQFFLDRVLIGTSTVGVPSTRMHTVLQTETATNGTVPADSAEGHLQLDWVAVYKQTSNPPPTTTTTVATTTSSSTTTTIPTGGDPVVAAAGDIACPGVCGQDETGALLEDLNPDVVLGLGDYQYETGTLANFLNYFDPYWGAFKPRMYVTNGGSHDFYGSGDYLTYFNSTTNGHGPTPHVNTAGDYYSFDIGAWHFINLDSYCNNSGTGVSCSMTSMAAFLAADLAAHTNLCSAVMFHEPYFTDTGGSNVHDPDNGLSGLLTTFQNAGGDVVLQAHNHFYERFYPQNVDRTANPNGLTAFLVGTGGRSHYSATTAAPNRAAYNDTTYGVLSMTLHATSMDFQFLPVAGSSFTDQGSVACH